MKSLLIACLLSLAACANSLAADKNEKPLSVTFTHGPNGAPRTAIFIAGERVYMKAVAKDIAIPQTGKCLLSLQYYIVDKDEKIAYSHRNDQVSTRVAVGYTDAKVLLECPVTTMLKPGEYFFVTEMREKESGQLYKNRQSFLVIPWDEFAISQFYFTPVNDKSIVVAPYFESCQPAMLNWFIQSPQADEDGIWHISIGIKIFDKAGHNVERSRLPTTFEKTATSRGVFPAYGEITITTPGTYIAEIEVKDLISGKVVTKSIPFRVFDSLSGVPRTPTL